MNQRSNTFIRTIICTIVLATQLIFLNQAHSAGPVGKIDDVDFSFEGVFATVAAWFLLNQILDINNILGCFFILCGVLLSQLLPLIKKTV